MAELGSINVKIGAITKGLDAGLKSASAKISSFTSGVKSMAAEVAKVGAVVGGAATALVGLTAVSANAAREIRTLSRVAGTTPQNFQKMAFAARAVNIEQEKLADILKDTQDRVGDFIQTGGGPMADFFENIAPKIGMTAKEFQNLSGPDALQKFYNGLQQSNLSASEMTFYMEAMASDASRLIPLLRDNGSGFEEAARQAERLGIVMSDIEVEQLTQTQDTITEIGGLFKAAGNAVALKFSPMVQEATKLIKEQIIEAGGIDKIMGVAYARVTAIVGQLADFLAHALNGFRLMRREFLRLSDDLGSVSLNLTKALGKVFLDDEKQGLLNELSLQRTGDQIDDLTQKINAFASNPLPSEQFDIWLAEIEAKSKESAEKIVEQRKALMDASIGVGGGQFDENGNRIDTGGQEAAAKEQEAMERQLEAFRESLRSQEESEVESHERRLEELALFLENRLITEQDFNSLLEDEEARHNDEMTRIAEEGAKRRAQAEQMVTDARKAATQTGVSLLDQFAGKSKAAAIAAIALNKALSIAGIIQNTAVAATRALAELGPIAGPPAAAKIKAYGAAQIALTAATGLVQASGAGGGGSGGLTSSGGVPAQNTTQSGGGGTNRLDVTLSGVSEDQLFSGTQIRGLINRINDELDDGAVIGNLRFQ